MKRPIILVIQKYLTEYLFKPKCNWSSYWFDERSYSRWAAYEIMTRIKEQKINPINIIEAFISQMDDFSSVREDTRHERIFSIARDTAKDILFIISKGENDEQTKLI